MKRLSQEEREKREELIRRCGAIIELGKAARAEGLTPEDCPYSLKPHQEVYLLWMLGYNHIDSIEGKLEAWGRTHGPWGKVAENTALCALCAIRSIPRLRYGRRDAFYSIFLAKLYALLAWRKAIANLGF